MKKNMPHLFLHSSAQMRQVSAHFLQREKMSSFSADISYSDFHGGA